MSNQETAYVAQDSATAGAEQRLKNVQQAGADMHPHLFIIIFDRDAEDINIGISWATEVAATLAVQASATAEEDQKKEISQQGLATETTEQTTENPSAAVVPVPVSDVGLASVIDRMTLGDVQRFAIQMAGPAATATDQAMAALKHPSKAPSAALFAASVANLDASVTDLGSQMIDDGALKGRLDALAKSNKDVDQLKVEFDSIKSRLNDLETSHNKNDSVLQEVCDVAGVSYDTTCSKRRRL